MSNSVQIMKAYAMALAEAIEASKELPLGGIPSGHLYAAVMGSMSLEQYQACIDALKGLKWVKESGHLLTWIKPVTATVKVQ